MALRIALVVAVSTLACTHVDNPARRPAQVPGLVLRASGLGELRASAALSRELVARSFPGRVVHAVVWPGEGETLRGFEVNGTVRILGESEVEEITISSPDIPSAAGVRVGDPFERVAGRVGGLRCRNEVQVDDDEAVMCQARDGEAVAYDFGDAVGPVVGAVDSSALLGRSVVRLVWRAPKATSTMTR
jgi:uncharacterized protein DUF1131